MKLTRAEVLSTFAIDSFTDSPGLTEQLAAVQDIRLSSWGVPSIKEALSIPAVFRAVSLISNTVGMLLLQAYRQGTLLAEQPTLVARPGLDGTPREFWRDWAYGLATRGEKIVRIVDRDENGRARKLMLLPGHEVQVEWDTRLPWLRNYRWRNMPLERDDIVHSTFLRDEWGLRGMGPLQMCGAALSAAVEAEEWAARFFSEGGVPSVLLKALGKVSKPEADIIIEQWKEKAGNTVRLVDMGMDAKELTINPEQGQLLGSRQYSIGSVATMFGMNGHLLNYAAAGSSLTYQNVGEVFVDFVRSTLAPGYLAPIEDAVSDLLPRGQSSRFNVQELYRADLRTRADVYKTLTDAGVPEPERRELAGFDVSAELAPIPVLTEIRPEVPVA